MAKKEKKLSRFVNNQFDFILFITVLLLLSIGIIMVLSASSPSSLSETGSSYTYVKKQALFAVVGIALMFIVSKIDYRFYRKFYIWIYIGSIVLLALVPIIGYDVNGAKRWIDLGFSSFQPSEVVKVGLIIFFATFLANNKDRLKNVVTGFCIPIAFLIPILAILILFQDHLSASVVIVAIISVMMLVAGSRISHFLTIGVGAGGLGLAGILLLGKGFRLNRITTFLNPWADKQGGGWQIIQSLYAIGSGGLFGVGLRRKQAKIFVYT